MKAALIYGCNKRRVPETKGCDIIHILFVAITAFADKSSINQAYRFVNKTYSDVSLFAVSYSVVFANSQDLPKNKSTSLERVNR